MKGDFSAWGFDPQSNDIAVLHQQGRGMLDRDWNTAHVITHIQKQQLAADTIGTHLAAVPADAKNSFQITEAEASASGVDITLNPGRIWVNGSVLHVRDWLSLPQPASYLPPPLHSPAVDTSSIAAGVRDAVVLEIWPEALSAYQKPLTMLEPALGGVDTTTRATLRHRLRLLRLNADDECGNIGERLYVDESSKGTLTVSADDIVITGDCPLAGGGGYTGFEHYLMRIEIADPDTDGARFKWSRFNGGLVGRGVKPAAEDRVLIQANDQMINHCGLTSFYLEALLENTTTGLWEIAFTADATLSADGELDLTNTSGTWPNGDGSEAFFRLWDGIAQISDFPTGADPDELDMGLQLQFTTPLADNSNYKVGDYWTFPLRAEGAVGFDAATHWPTAAPPEGVHYSRVPLGIITWADAVPTTATAPADIHDCRRIFQPLTKLDSCCYFTVGDGMHTFGDFDRIQDAIDALPDSGGEICVLRGTYTENVVINKNNVTLHGCGERSMIAADTDAPAVYISARNVTIKTVAIQAHENGIGLHVENGELQSRFITVNACYVSAASRPAMQVDDAQHITFTDNIVAMRDVASAFHALLFTADDVHIEHNRIGIAREDNFVLVASAGRAGIHIGGTSERVAIIDNDLVAGIGNGITLGSVVDVNQSSDGDGREGWIANKDDPCDPCAPGTTYVPPNSTDPNRPVYQSTGALYDIRIERNRIHNFGLNGIGVIAFFNLEAEDQFISVNQLQILGNTITHNCRRELEQIPDEMIDSMGYGGISLADVETLIVHDNHIVDNGPNYLYPICGIYVLTVEGADISRNRIQNNGARTDQSATDAQPGARAGIWIQYASAPKMIVEVLRRFYPRQNGIPALSVANNIVVQPLGRALSVTALGPVTVTNNQLTSQNFIYGGGSPSLFAATVFIFNMGISNELYMQQILFSGENIDDVPPNKAIAENEDFYVAAQTGLDEQRFFNYLGNGNVLCNDNQIMLDLSDRTGFQLGISSIAIASLDDVSFQDNQCDIAYDFLFDEIILSQSFIIGWTTRVMGNRFKEAILGALYSGLTMSLFSNFTLNNQATHCLRAFNLLGPANLLDGPNAVLADIFGVCPDDDNMQQGMQVLTDGNSGVLAGTNNGTSNVLRLLN